MLHPWSSVFIHEQIEAQYTAEVFRSSTKVATRAFAIFALVQSLFLLIIGQEHASSVGAMFLCEIVWLATLMRLQHMADLQQARRMFGHVIAAATLICWTAVLLWMRTFPPATIAAPMVVLDAAIWGSTPIVIHALTLPRGSHLVWLASVFLGMFLMPEWSDLGRPWETLCLWAALLAGEAAGYTMQRRKRVAWWLARLAPWRAVAHQPLRLAV